MADATTPCAHCGGTGRTPIGGYDVLCGHCWGTCVEPDEREGAGS